MDAEQRLIPAELTAQHRKSLDEAQRLEPAVMGERAKLERDAQNAARSVSQQMQLDANLKTLLTKQEVQTALSEMQMSADEFAKQAGRLNESYSSNCKALIESTKNALTAILNDTKKRLSDTAQEARKKIITCAWISAAVVILCAALCALAMLWSR